jgi:hypothetical protein
LDDRGATSTGNNDSDVKDRSAEVAAFHGDSAVFDLRNLPESRRRAPEVTIYALVFALRIKD